MSSLYTCTSASSKSGVNQDSCILVENSDLNFTGIIIADGIGSHFRSELGSTYACTKLKELLEATEQLEDISFETFFNQIRIGLIEWAKHTKEFDFNEINTDQSLGTTLICVIELEKEYVIAYVGNGCIWHIDGGFNQFGKNYYIPWNSINLLNPHSVEQEGKAALNRFISISNIPCSPTIIRLTKNTLSPGEIIVVATDGVYSTDQLVVGKDELETIWIKAEQTMSLLYEHLSLMLSHNPINLTSEDVKFHLNRYLDEAKEKNLMNDDMTLGVILPKRVIDYHQQFFEKSPKPQTIE